jgi:hypothetical protein
LIRQTQTQDSIVNESKATISELTKSKELFEREYKLIKNLYEALKKEYPDAVTTNILIINKGNKTEGSNICYISLL